MATRRESTDEYIKRIVDAAPPLTPEQRDKIALLLRFDDDREAPKR